MRRAGKRNLPVLKSSDIDSGEGSAGSNVMKPSQNVRVAPKQAASVQVTVT